MKKILFLLSFILLPFITFAQESVELKNEEEMTIVDASNLDEKSNALDEINTNTVDVDAVSDEKSESIEINEISENEVNTDENFDPLRWLYFGFCDNGFDNLTTLYNGAGKLGEPFKICVMFYNSSDRDITLKTDLSNAFVDTDGTNSCTLDFSFYNFLTSGELGVFTVPANNYLTKEFEITFPLGYEGNQMGCISYRAVDPDFDGDEGIAITVRKGFYMNFFVGSLSGIKNELVINDLSTNIDDNGDLILSFWVENTGNMENKFDIQGAVKGLFGYNKKFEIVSGQVAPSKSQYVEANLGSLPSYGGKFNIDFSINATPFFSYDISNANVDPSWLEPKTFDFGTTYFKMPWLILVVVVIFILLLIVLFRKPKQKVVYVQQPQIPQQPVQLQQPQIPQQ